MKPTKAELKKIADAVYHKFQFIADQVGKKEFIVSRVKMALETGARTYHEILFLALNAPLLQPNAYAIQAVKETLPAYLELLDDSLKPYHAEIIELAIEFHEHILYPSGTNGDPRNSAIDTWQQFASELYYRIPLGFDWDAVAYFIITDSTEHGKALQIQAEHGPDTLAYKGVLPNGCHACKRAYQKPDGKPITIKVKDLIHNNANSLGQRIFDDQASELPTSGPNHLYCTCQLHKHINLP